MTNTELPEQIEITFTEEDRIKAQHYISCYGCLLATALHRLGYSNVSVRGWGETKINGEQEYTPQSWTEIGPLITNCYNNPAPHYPEIVVGKTVILIKARP